MATTSNNNGGGSTFFDVITKGLETFDNYKQREMERDLTWMERNQELLLSAQQIRQQTNELQGEAARETAMEALQNPLLWIAGLLGIALTVSVVSRS